MVRIIPAGDHPRPIAIIRRLGAEIKSIGRIPADRGRQGKEQTPSQPRMHMRGGFAGGSLDALHIAIEYDAAG